MITRVGFQTASCPYIRSIRNSKEPGTSHSGFATIACICFKLSGANASLCGLQPSGWSGDRRATTPRSVPGALQPHPELPRHLGGFTPEMPHKLEWGTVLGVFPRIRVRFGHYGLPFGILAMACPICRSLCLELD